MKIDWSVDDVFIADISPRSRTDDRTKEQHDYHVIKFKGIRPEKRTCICFNNRLLRGLGVGISCGLRGEVSFGVGSTYLLLKHVIDDENRVSVASQSG